MHVQFPLQLRIEHLQLANLTAVMARYVNQPGIAHLAAHFGVERRLIEDDVPFRAL